MARCPECGAVWPFVFVHAENQYTQGVFSGVGWRARCDCGWASETKQTRSEALSEIGYCGGIGDCPVCHGQKQMRSADAEGVEVGECPVCGKD